MRLHLLKAPGINVWRKINQPNAGRLIASNASGLERHQYSFTCLSVGQSTFHPSKKHRPVHGALKHELLHYRAPPDNSKGDRFPMSVRPRSKPGPIVALSPLTAIEHGKILFHCGLSGALARSAAIIPRALRNSLSALATAPRAE